MKEGVPIGFVSIVDNEGDVLGPPREIMFGGGQ